MTATIELNSARRKLCSALGERQKDYFAYMKSWFRKRCTKEEFDVEARKLLTPENGHLHNEFLLAILNKCQTLASFQPMVSITNKAGIDQITSIQTPMPGARTGVKVDSAPAKIACVDPSIILASRKYEDDRLKVGRASGKKSMSIHATFDHRFQQVSTSAAAPNLDEIHTSVRAIEGDEPILVLAHREPTLPDAGLIQGRLLLAAWEEGRVLI